MFSNFSLDGGTTPNPDALLEQVGLQFALSRNRQDIAMDIMQACEGAELLHWFFDAESAYPASCAYRQNGVLYIQVSGTNQELQGNYQNVVGCMQSTVIGQAGTVINSWFNECANKVEQRLDADLPANWRTLPRRFMGSSQGAGVAFALGVFLASSNPSGPWDWFGFAAPRVFGGPLVPNGLLPRWGFVVINGDDPVPRLPPNRLLYSIRLSPVSPLTWGTVTDWRHYGRIMQLLPQGEATFYSPGIDESPLTPGMLAAVDLWHMCSSYAYAIQTYWRSRRA